MGEKETATLDDRERKAGAGMAQESTSSMPSGRVAAGDLDGDGTPEAAINNTKSNIKNQMDDPGGGVGAGDSGSQREIAVGDEGVPEDKVPKSKK